MDFYMCETAEGQQLAGTQADAKALDRNFKSHEVPTAKAPLMGYINALLKRLGPKVAVIPAMTPEMLAEFERFKSEHPPVIVHATPLRDGLPKDYRGHADDCPGCMRSKRAAELMGHSDQITAIEEIIQTLDEDFAIRRIEEALNERKKARAVQPVATPRARMRPSGNTLAGVAAIVAGNARRRPIA